VATVATLAALPVIISGLTSGKEGAPPVAALPGGADLGDSLRAAAGSIAPSTEPTIPEQQSKLPLPTQATQPAVIEIAVPQTEPATSAKGKAGYRHFGGLLNRTTPPCATSIVPVGTRVTVTNVDNGHQLVCSVVSSGPLVGGVDIAIETSAFSALGDPVQSPISVRLTW
jgi:hypothetical protein